MQISETSLQKRRHFRRQPNPVNHACAACLRRECPAPGQGADAFTAHEVVAESQPSRIFLAFEQGLDPQPEGVGRFQYLPQTNRLILS